MKPKTLSKNFHPQVIVLWKNSKICNMIGKILRREKGLIDWNSMPNLWSMCTWDKLIPEPED
jgi:hypothetical protein